MNQPYRIDSRGKFHYTDFNTVDDMVNYFKSADLTIRLQSNIQLEDQAIKHIVMFIPDILLRVLNKETNTHIEYDLLIINEVNKGSIVDDHKHIIEIYNKRK